MQRVCSFLLVTSSVALGAPSAGTKVSSNADEHSCRSGFFYREGWCTAVGPSFYSFSGAVDYCRGLGAFAPSIHSSLDLSFWEGSAFDLTPRFWLDASCQAAGEPYVWRDGTPTDYMGPFGELQSCTPNYGFELGSSGFINSTYAETSQAVCVYPVDPLPEPAPIDGNGQYCKCNTSTIELDIVFALDSSSGVKEKEVGDMNSFTQATLFGLPLGATAYKSNAAVIAFSDNTQVVRDFGQLITYDDVASLSTPYLRGTANFAGLFDQATSMLSSTGRTSTRKVIVLMSKSDEDFDYAAANKASDRFRQSGGIVIVIDFSYYDDSLSRSSSPGYFIKMWAGDTNMEIQAAFCDANCFCPSDLIPYPVPNAKGRDVPMGCYRVSDVPSIYDTAQQDCHNQGGFVATVHDDAKNFFLLSLFPVKSPFWLGFKEYFGVFVWADGSNDGYTWWAPGNPVKNVNCVYAQQTTGFNTAWYSAPCSDTKYSLLYACQTRPFDTENSGIL